MGTRYDFMQVMKLVFDGKLNVPVDRVFTLKEARQAQEHLALGEQLGKVVLDVRG